jgi:hypothetical protein
MRDRGRSEWSSGIGCVLLGLGLGLGCASDDGGSEAAGETGDATGGDGDPSGDGDGDGDGDPSGDGDGDPSGDGDGDPTGDGDGDGDGEPERICDPPLELYDTSNPTTVVGTGTPASCTATALAAAVAAGGVIRFDCGPDPVTITLTQTLLPPVDADTIVDGAGLVTLDGGGAVRLFLFDHPDWMNNPSKLVLQRLRLIGGQAPAGEYFAQDPQNPLCAYGYKEGSGGAVYMRNGVLHVIDSRFEGNQAALIGPDVGGGAIYVLGVPQIVVTGSSFVGNRGANGGAIGILFAGDPQIVNSRFEDNTAEGTGQNYVEPGCPNFNHDDQGGAGGNSGAVYFDGLNDADQVYRLCGAVFRNNRANELGGALFRTPNVGMRELVIDRCSFDGNTGRMGGVSFIKDNLVTVRASTFRNNRSGVTVDGTEVGGPLGGLWVNNGTVAIENSTFANNQPSGLDVEGGGTVVNTTFIQSRPGGSMSVRNSLFVDTSCSASLAGSDNVQWPAGGNACAAGVAFADPQLGELADNGGPTATAMPGALAGLEIGLDCPSVDQRGEARDPSSCVVGSVEP